MKREKESLITKFSLSQSVRQALGAAWGPPLCEGLRGMTIAGRGDGERGVGKEKEHIHIHIYIPYVLAREGTRSKWVSSTGEEEVEVNVQAKRRDRNHTHTHTHLYTYKLCIYIYTYVYSCCRSLDCDFNHLHFVPNCSYPLSLPRLFLIDKHLKKNNNFVQKTIELVHFLFGEDIFWSLKGK